MLELIFANLRVRFFRTLISVIGVALGVVLIVLFTGLAKGMTEDMAKRSANWKAEIVFARPGGMEFGSSNMNVSTAYVSRLEAIEGVAAAVPVGRYISADPKARWGLLQLDGVDWEPFAKMNGMSITQGRAPQANDEVILDERQIRNDKAKLGDEITLFGNKQFKIVGVFEPPSGSRIKMSLAAMQSVLEETDKCTYILVKVKDGADVPAVAARINEQLPGNKVNLTSDLIIDAKERVPGLNTFLRVLVGLGAFVSIVFVLLSMYTTITERRKEIGILKSLGASRTFIVTTIEGEALLIGIAGIVIGFITAFGASAAISHFAELQFDFSPVWVISAIVIAIFGSLFGALYPALRASGIDPVEVMVNE
ncbi:MAG: lipoprotein release ABC transporter permease [Acidobacteria bacterium OLB17]|nr:MAG: lipoprotein release ABC transporter permease [Acidobacteria bacterium OLB17]MCZ2389991.1 ABC transporter permease [Acidobacteriota bacterium]